MSKPLIQLQAEYASIFHDSRYLCTLTLTGKGIKDPLFFESLLRLVKKHSKKAKVSG